MAQLKRNLSVLCMLKGQLSQTKFAFLDGKCRPDLILPSRQRGEAAAAVRHLIRFGLQLESGGKVGTENPRLQSLHLSSDISLAVEHMTAELGLIFGCVLVGRQHIGLHTHCRCDAGERTPHVATQDYSQNGAGRMHKGCLSLTSVVAKSAYNDIDEMLQVWTEDQRRWHLVGLNQQQRLT